jgi:hypothetical protein
VFSQATQFGLHEEKRSLHLVHDDETELETGEKSTSGIQHSMSHSRICHGENLHGPERHHDFGLSSMS